jgi:hypothetical protein
MKHDVFVLQLLVTANVVYSSLILFTLMMEAIRSSKTSILTRATRRHVQGNGILQSVFFFFSNFSCILRGTVKLVLPFADISLTLIHRLISVVPEQKLFYVDTRVCRFPLSIILFQGPRRKRWIEVSLYKGTRLRLKCHRTVALRHIVLVLVHL